MEKVIDTRLLEELNKFDEWLKKHEYIYIYGNGSIGRSIKKLLDYLNYPNIMGFITSNGCEDSININTWNGYDAGRTGIILGLSDRFYHEIFPFLGEKGVELKDIYTMTGSNKSMIELRMKPYEINDFHYSVHLAEHCNLNCKMCNQFSPIATEELLDIEKYEKDCKRLSSLFQGNMKWINLTGGEALLHPEINKIIHITRANFPNAQIKLCTNGLLLGNAESKFWETCKKNNIELWVTPYPIKLQHEKIAEQAKKFDVHLYDAVDLDSKDLSDENDKTSWSFPLDIEGKQNRLHAIQCLMYQSFITLYEGKIYNCSTIYPSKHFCNQFNVQLNVNEADFIDIYKAKDYRELCQFVNTIPVFCKYCNLGNRERGHEWGISNREYSEWT